MTTFLLIRHALHDFGGDRIAGRTPDVHLSPDGRTQAEAMGQRLRTLPIRAIYSSPMERTRETAAYVSSAVDVPVEIAPELTELDFGDWMGCHLEDLRQQKAWGEFNSFRSGTRAPNGELMIETQSRIVTLMTRLHARHPDEYVALFSHGDVIKSAVAYYLGVPLDLFQRIEISPASVSVVGVAEYGPWVLGVNHVGDLPSLPG